MPKPEVCLAETDPGRFARSYDIVVNGSEIGGGSSASIPNTKQDVPRSDFRRKRRRKIRILLEAFKYGTPPHGGLAFGLDRLVATMLELDDIRDVIAFPKVQNASELMTGCPSPTDDQALAELGITVVDEE